MKKVYLLTVILLLLIIEISVNPFSSNSMAVNSENEQYIIAGCSYVPVHKAATKKIKID